jgi:hypothetical protein
MAPDPRGPLTLRVAASSIVAAILVMLAVCGTVRGVEGTDTDVNVTLVFGVDCRGSGAVEIWDPGGRTSEGEAVVRKELTWSPGYAIHIMTVFGGAASPRLRLVDVAGTRLVEIALAPWGSGPPDDRYAISCRGQRYSAVPDIIPTLGTIAVLLGLLLTLGRLWSRFAWRRGTS